MSQSKKLIPKRRFKGFIEDWILSILGISKDVRDGTHDSPSYYKKGFPLITSKNLTDSGLDMDNVSLISQSDFDTINKRSKVNSGDILFGMIGTIGNPVLVNQDNFAIKNVALIKEGGEILNIFLLQVFKSKIFDKYISSQHVGNTQKFLALSKIRELNLFIPSIKEQTKIGEFFKKLDNLISTQQKKLEKAKTLKSAYLREMFPNEGELKPRLRFIGFTKDWYIKEINNLANRYDNLRIPITASNRKVGLTPYYGANGIQDHVQGFTHDGEYILIAEDGANDFKNYPVQYVKGKIWVNNHAHVLQGKTGICDNKFLMNAFKNINIEPYLVGGSRAKLNSDTMMNITLKVPNQPEQTKIGNFFKLFDDKIALEQKKLDKLKNIKQAYLNEMFV
ncbi:restriction endonuclease subunit S [Snodgrassella alvi]|uniref:Type I restriction modification DNA specificity domain-containing protein n=1 Tax=Snodgrassella alvi TaxID=1196083 RepID=A0A2N9XX95_9NEIS|nr:restriction endonuclease subunit S [Snodgrassella alvi]PIT54502.1 hypothetical protein BHC49_08100 [Snodgrassella alvi]